MSSAACFASSCYFFWKAACKTTIGVTGSVVVVAVAVALGVELVGGASGRPRVIGGAVAVIVDLVAVLVVAGIGLSCRVIAV